MKSKSSRGHQALLLPGGGGHYSGGGRRAGALYERLGHRGLSAALRLAGQCHQGRSCKCDGKYDEIGLPLIQADKGPALQLYASCNASSFFV